MSSISIFQSELKMALLTQLDFAKRRLKLESIYTGSIIESINLTSQQNKGFCIICCICRKSVLEGQETFTCLKCLTQFHSAHIAEWLHIKDYCPICHVYITQDFFQRTKVKEVWRAKETGIPAI